MSNVEINSHLFYKGLFDKILKVLIFRLLNSYVVSFALSFPNLRQSKGGCPDLSFSGLCKLYNVLAPFYPCLTYLSD